MAKKTRILIIGAGFGGLSAAQHLGGRDDCEVLLIDRKNHHLFQPLLYQVATAGLSPADIAVPIRGELSHLKNVEVHLGEVEAIDLVGKTVRADGVTVTFDKLVVATGAQHAYFGHPEWEEFAPGLKSLEQATEIRRRILMAFESAENTQDEAEKKRLLTFVVVGGGPTGAELSGALAEISRNVIAEDFRRIDPKEARIVLIEAGPRVLAMFAPELSARAERDLKSLGVEVRTGTRVTGIDADGVSLGGERIEAATKLWAAGVFPSPLGKALGVPTDHSGRVIVAKDLSLGSVSATGRDVFVIGDLANATGKDRQALPGLAPVAIQSGKNVAKNILRDLAGKPRVDFHYLDKGQMATIGKHRAICQVGKVRFAGWIAWLAWLFIHVLYLVGFRNRVAVLSQWAWSFIFSQRSARLIVGKTWRFYDSAKSAMSPNQP